MWESEVEAWSEDHNASFSGSEEAMCAARRCTSSGFSNHMQNKKKTRAMVEFLACAVVVPHVTPSVLTNRDEEMTDMSHRAW